MSINKKACRKSADPFLKMDVSSGVLHAIQVDYIVRTAMKNIDGSRHLLLHVYPRKHCISGIFVPEFTVFQGKDDFIALQRFVFDKPKWRTAKFNNLDRMENFNRQCAFYSSEDEDRVTKFCSCSGKTGFDALERFQNKIKSVQELERRHQIQMPTLNRMSTLKSLPRNMKSFLQKEVMPAYIYYDYNKGKGNVIGFCSSCEKEGQIPHPKHNSEGVCPRCKRQVIFKSRGRRGYINDRETVQVIQQISANELIIRILKVYSVHRKKDASEMTYYDSIRIFVTRNSSNICKCEPFHHCYNSGDVTPWKEGYPMVRYYYQENFHAETCGHLYHRNLDKELMATPWQYSQLKEFYLSNREELTTANYLEAYLKMPSLEYLVKLNLIWLASHAVYGSHNHFGIADVFNRNGKTFKEVIGIEKSDIPILQKSWMGVKELVLLQLMRKANLNPCEKLLHWVHEKEIRDVEKIAKLLKYTSTNKLIGYLDKQYEKLKDVCNRHGNARFEQFGRVLSEYKDYISFCETLKYDLKDEFILFPRNLGEAHDRASSRIDVEKVAKYDKQIANAYANLMAQYQFEKNGFTIFPPKTSAEIVTEGHKLHHCVGSYVSRVAKQDCIILFVRKSDVPNTPFYTVEISNNQISQARGDDNGSPPPEVKKFLKQFAKRKKLKTAA